MNLFMHYVFDAWMQRTYPGCPFARYADDTTVHCRSELQAIEVTGVIEASLEEGLLSIHPYKSKIVYCKDSTCKAIYVTTQFTFLVITFRPRVAWATMDTGLSASCLQPALKRRRKCVSRPLLEYPVANVGQLSGSVKTIQRDSDPSGTG